MEGDDLGMGCLLSLKTTLGDEPNSSPTIAHPTSSFFCYGTISLLLLQEGSKDSPNRKIQLLKASYIKEFILIGQGDDPLDLKHCHLDLNLLQSRADAALRQAEIDAERIGVGVTNEAQNICDALSKSLPVRWDRTFIVVMNEVRVSSPLPENVSGGTSAANERVKKVLEFERKRLHARGASQ